MSEPASRPPAPGPPSGRRAGLVVLLASFVGHGGNYLFYVIAARMVTPAEFAAISAIIAFATIVFMPVNGIQVAVARDVAMLRAGGRDDELAGYLRRLGRRSLLFCAATLVLLVALSPLLARLLELGSGPLALAGLWIGLGAALLVATGVAQGMERFGYVSFALAGPLGMLRTVLLPLCVLVAGVAGGIWAMIAATAIGLTVLVPPVVRAARTGTALAPPVLPSVLVTMIALLAFSSLTNVDMLVAQAALGEAERAHYASAALLGKVALFAPSALALVLLPRATAAIERGQSADRAVLKTLGMTAACGLVVAGLLWAMPTSLLTLMFGSAFAGAKPLLLPLALVMTAAAVLWVHLTFATAKRSGRMTVLLVAAAVGHWALLAVLHATPMQIILASATAILVTLVVIEVGSSSGIVRMLRRAMAPPLPAPPPPDLSTPVETPHA